MLCIFSFEIGGVSVSESEGRGFGSDRSNNIPLISTCDLRLATQLNATNPISQELQVSRTLSLLPPTFLSTKTDELILTLTLIGGDGRHRH